MKTEGVKNFGASNATIVLGKKFGALVAAIDIGKGIIAIILARMIAVQSSLSDENSALIIFLAGAAVVIGHIFPFYMHFNGGKGTATIIGILFGIDWRLGILAFIVFVVATLATDFIVSGVLMLYISLLIFSIWFTPGVWPPILALGLFVIAILKHYENIKRMRIGQESRVSTVFKKEKK